ncbi:MAG: glucokinase [Candidatus Rokubacteria bacterium]|nr:glucokinase [Candidatus Rokubacteria bacterium]
MILAGDVGGTKTALGLFADEPAGPRLLRGATLPSREFGSLEAAIRRFLDDEAPGEVGAACFGVAGPVVDGRCVTTNLPWELDEGHLAKAIPARRVKLVNDLEAGALGVLGLPASDLETIQRGPARAGNKVVIAAGTGLGEAICVWDGVRYAVIASEGGHADFAPRGDLEIELLRFLAAELGHVSWERVLSGPGLHNVYRFLRDTGRAAEPPWLRERLAAGDPGVVITEVGLAGGDPLCAGALDLFVSLYGAEAGNLALKALAVGGVILAGGIAPKIRAKLAGETFVRAFRDKGRFATLMSRIPVHVALDPAAPLLGAAGVARDLAAGR